MENNKQILERVKLLMKYELGKTLEENIKNEDNILNEQAGIFKNLFRIGGEELVGGLRAGLEDATRIFREVGGIEIKSAEGAVIKAKNADELIDALHTGRYTNNTIGEIYSGLLRSPKTPANVIDHIIANPAFEAKFKITYGPVMNDSEKLYGQLKRKGYSDETIQKMMNKMGVQKTATNVGAKLTDDEISDMLKNLNGQFDGEGVKNSLREFAKKRGLKINEKQLEQVAEDVVIELGKMNKNFKPEEFERIWTTKMTTKDKENLIKKVIATPPPGMSGELWSDYVTNALKSGAVATGKGVGKIFVSIWKAGLQYAGLYYGGSYLTGWYGDTQSIPGAIWKTVTWPYHFLKYMLPYAKNQDGTTNVSGGQPTIGGGITDYIKGGNADKGMISPNPNNTTSTNPHHGALDNL